MSTARPRHFAADGGELESLLTEYLDIPTKLGTLPKTGKAIEPHGDFFEKLRQLQPNLSFAPPEQIKSMHRFTAWGETSTEADTFSRTWLNIFK